MNLFLGYPIFRGYVIFRESIGYFYSATIATGGQQGDEPSGAFDEALRAGTRGDVYWKYS